MFESSADFVAADYFLLGVSARTRHYESWQHFVRDAFERLILSVHLVDTNSMVADILTKALPKLESNYFKFKNIIMNIFE